MHPPTTRYTIEAVCVCVCVQYLAREAGAVHNGREGVVRGREVVKHGQGEGKTLVSCIGRLYAVYKTHIIII